MILVSRTGNQYVVYRQTVAYEGSTGRNWNINPVELVREQRTGYFVIAKWGSGRQDDYQVMIKVSSVEGILNLTDWERPESPIFKLPTLRKIRS